ncbi:uncharacterized protein LOC117214896 [Bombus bifarius]|uniref:Uncharacterized protein LOC117214896 n=1 Tax=Bombus bifarius TaxID=103933 RepID=A0A6P8N9X7_9HYME|nr:uncharacterized protein LOC117214896 [Bombus bifarius]
MKINKIEEEINVFVVRNDNFTYDLTLGFDAIKKFKLRQDENLRTTQEVNHKEGEIIFKKKEERKNDWKRKKINNTEYMWTDKFVDNVEADSLSRNLVLENFENEENVLKVANLITRQEIIQDQEVNRKSIGNTKNVTQKSEIFCKNIRGF